MRAFKPDTVKKQQQKSRFFECFNNIGGIQRASVVDIQKNMHHFLKDLIFGNIVQEKYMEILMSDPRIIQEAITYTEQNLIENHIILQSMNCAVNCKDVSIITLPAFNNTYTKYSLKANTYGVLLTELRNFMSSGNAEYLIGISVKLNSPFMRGSKQQFLL